VWKGNLKPLLFFLRQGTKRRWGCRGDLGLQQPIVSITKFNTYFQVFISRVACSLILSLTCLLFFQVATESWSKGSMEAEALINEEERSKETWAHSLRGDGEYTTSDEYINRVSYSKLLSRDRRRLLSYSYEFGRHVDRRSFLAAAIIAMLGILGMVYFLFASTGMSRTATISPPASAEIGHKPYFADFYKNNKAALGTFPLQVPTEFYDDFCSICDCHAKPPFYSPHLQSKLAPRPLVADVQPTPKTVDVNEYMRKTLLDMYCAYVQLTPDQALKLLQRAVRDLGEVASWSLAGLDYGLPTIYLTTATSPNGNAKALRPQYFRRHGKTIQSWILQRNPGWQVVWVVAEDEEHIDQRIARTLRDSNVPYIYFAYGLTRSYGNAQKNAVLQVTYALSGSNGGLFGHGPVYGLDDDNKILPELLTLLTKLTRIGAFPVGNLARGWESPILDDAGFIIDTDSDFKRKFSFDYGGYSFNSSLLGTLISAPALWKHTQWAGESEFVEQIVGSIRDVEPLCGEAGQENCHYVWHNEPLTDVEKLIEK
jgi:hypothetical protein